jgi:hypothetical protein
MRQSRKDGNVTMAKKAKPLKGPKVQLFPTEAHDCYASEPDTSAWTKSSNDLVVSLDASFRKGRPRMVQMRFHESGDYSCLTPWSGNIESSFRDNKAKFLGRVQSSEELLVFLLRALYRTALRTPENHKRQNGGQPPEQRRVKMSKNRDSKNA